MVIKFAFGNTNESLQAIHSPRAFRADAHVESDRVVLPLIVRRIYRYDCGGKQWMKKERKKKRGMNIEKEPFRSCHGLRIAVTCHPQIRLSPKHVRLGLLLFIYPGSPLDPFTRFAVTSPFVPCTLLSVVCSSILLPPPPPFSSPFFSCRVRSAPESTDVTEGQTRPGGPVSVFWCRL